MRQLCAAVADHLRVERIQLLVLAIAIELIQQGVVKADFFRALRGAEYQLLRSEFGALLQRSHSQGLVPRRRLVPVGPGIGRDLLPLEPEVHVALLAPVGTRRG